MVDYVKISELPAASAAALTDQLETNQAGTSRRITVNQLLASGASALDGYLYGLTLSNNSTTGINFAPGKCADATNTSLIVNTTSMNKLISATWATGTGAGGLGTSVTRVASTWYHMFGGTITATGLFDAFYDTSVTGANKPAGFGPIRRLGSILTGTGGTPPIIAFTQSGDWFGWGIQEQDFTTANALSGTINRTIRVPTGIIVTARMLWQLSLTDTVTPTTLTVFDPAVTVNTATAVAQMIALNGTLGWAGIVQSEIEARTNVSGQVATVVLGTTGASAGTAITCTVVGWTDTRGRNG